MISNGDKVLLVPGSGKRSRSIAEMDRFHPLLEFLIEQVTVVAPEHVNGNALVVDCHGIMFFCNPRDL
jgi:hypothetical protein